MLATAQLEHQKIIEQKDAKIAALEAKLDKISKSLTGFIKFTKDKFTKVDQDHRNLATKHAQGQHQTTQRLWALEQDRHNHDNDYDDEEDGYDDGNYYGNNRGRY